MLKKHTDRHYELPFKKPMNQLLYIRICCLQRKGQDLSGEGMLMSEHSRTKKTKHAQEFISICYTWQSKLFCFVYFVVICIVLWGWWGLLLV